MKRSPMPRWFSRSPLRRRKQVRRPHEAAQRLRIEALETRTMLNGSGYDLPCAPGPVANPAYPPVAYPQGTIQGIKFNDLNGDGQYQPGEPGLVNWMIGLIDATSCQVVAEAWTAPDGSYAFTGVRPGSYYARESREPGWTQTTPQPSLLTINGNDITTLDEPELAFGNYASTTDFGDAPASFGPGGYPTLAAGNGARHSVSSLYLGSRIDADVDGQPTSLADGDDVDPDGNDDDGVKFLTPLIPGTVARIEVRTSQNGRLDAWADFNRDGDWSDTFEQIFASQPLVSGITQLSFQVPFPYSDFGQTYLRFRVSAAGGLAPAGAAPDGEVEDYSQAILAADFGDAPDIAANTTDYPTLRASNGAAHALPGSFPPSVSPQLWLGDINDAPDADEDGQPNQLNLGGDDGDLVFGDDEDGVAFLGVFPSSTDLIPGLTNFVNVTVTHLAGGSGLLSAWLDFNRDGDWSDAGEQIFTDVSLGDGSAVGTTHTLSFPVPANATPGKTYARFRFATQGGLAASGLAWDGEVEDVADVQIATPYDWGDAPDNSLVPDDYPTTAAKDGARHVIVPGVHLGQKVDPELNGQPTALADGDDTDNVFVSNSDDEDGIRLLTPLVPGTTALVEVKATVAGYLSAWVDFTGDQNWDDPQEHAFTAVPVGMGFNQLSFPVPNGAALGATYARFRFSTQPLALTDHGAAPDGEVEDYRFAIEPADFGDAPDPKYPTLIAHQGAGHATAGNSLVLGAQRDVEPDGLPDNNALGDDGVVPAADDEDGVAFQFTRSPGKLLPGTTDTVNVVVAGAPASGAYLDAWIDFNQDGDWTDAWEQIALSDPIIAGPNVGNGTNSLTFTVPASAVPGATFARFRLSQQGGLTPVGLAFAGEVEDHKVLVDIPLDFGDAPEGPDDPLDYQTTLARNGARHRIIPGVQLGERNDPEINGQPSAAANADDLTTPLVGDDEDGVRFLTPLIPGAQATVQVTASVAGYLNAWIDFDVNMRWDTTGEQVFLNQPLLAGTNTLTFLVPASLTPPAGSLPLDTVSRFRFTSQLPSAGFSFTGAADDGEVEDHQVTLFKGDWGDAPDPTYPSLSASMGAVHAVIPLTTPVALPSTLFLGTLVDGELNGQPTSAANGDDNALQDDEDGVSFATLLMPGTQASLSVTVGGVSSISGRYLDAWIDFNADGDWLDPGEHVVDSDGVSSNVSLGVNTLSFSVPASSRVGQTYARVRLSSAGNLSPIGSAWDGEVEDYRVEVVTPLDFGDAPSLWRGNPTLFATATASHAMVTTGPQLGARRDADLAGQPTAAANGDDVDFEGDDEDGVRLLTPLVQGAMAQVEVNVSSPGLLNAWFDFNSDGDWADPGERVATDRSVAAGANSLTFQVPFTPLDPAALPLQIVSRFRVSTASGLDASSAASDGEVEDHLFTIYQGDYGDAPEDLPQGDYPTLRASNGAGHAINVAGTPVILLGNWIDEDSDGQPDQHALGDDLDTIAPPDDEDGVVFTSLLEPGNSATVSVFVRDLTVPAPPVPMPQLLSAWIDFNGDGDWSDSGEQVFTNQTVFPGSNSLTFQVPANATPTRGVSGRGFETFSRWRLSSQANLGVTGLAFNGEVEDHAVEIETPLDWGDAPDQPLFAQRQYGTLSTNDGARHPIRLGMSLGSRVDAETNGQPDIAALADDNQVPGSDDEDGVVFPSLLIPGNTGSAVVVATLPANISGKLDAWIDFNGDGDFLDPPERIAANLALVNGSNTVTFTVPSDAPQVATMARFRLSSVGGLAPTGLAVDGEVEDHLVLIGANIDFGDAPDPAYPTRLANNGARHLVIPNVHLGAAISGNDADLDGQPSAGATGDDLDGTDDEDGIVFSTSLVAGHQAAIQATVQNVGYLSAWFDYNQDGDWADPGELAIADSLLNPSLNPSAVTFVIPASANAGSTFARFRFSTVRGLSFSGPAPDGEVEDYRVDIARDPNLPSISVSDVTLTEGNSGTVNAAFVVTVAPSALPVTVQYATSDGTASVSGNDYQVRSGTLAFPASPNAQTQTVLVPVVGDTQPEGDETFMLNLTSPVNANVADGQGVATIVNDDAAIVAYTIVLKDTAGQVLSTNSNGQYEVTPGTRINAEVYADDLRTLGTYGGVFAAYADLTYSLDQFDFVPGSLVIAAALPNSRSGSMDEPNRLIDEAGGATGFAPPGSDPAQLVFTVGLEAKSNATPETIVQLVLNAADLATHNTLVWGQTGAVPASYDAKNIKIVLPGIPWKNPLDPYDVNADELVSNEDLQAILEELRRPGGGPRQLVHPPEPLPPNYWDVNGDGNLTVLDAGAVRDELNRRAGMTLRAELGEAPLAIGQASTWLAPTSVGPMLQAAVARLVNAGLPTETKAALDAVSIVVVDLGEDLLARTRGHEIALDDDAAGWGWFVDSTPDMDEEFTADDAGQLTLRDGLSKIDLLTVLAHELAHVAGVRSHSASPDDILAAGLGAGIRKTNFAALVDEILGGDFHG